MCRWLAYSGGPLALSDLIFNTTHSLVDQSLSARSSVQTTNGDGFGIGWYDHCDEPGVYKHIQPAWNDPNLRDLCDHMQSNMFVAHVRAATDTAIQRTNCHPFRYGKWLFVHNGQIRGFEKIRRELAVTLRPELFALLTARRTPNSCSSSPCISAWQLTCKIALRKWSASLKRPVGRVAPTIPCR